MAALLPDDLTRRAQAIIDEWRPRLGLSFPAWHVVLELDEDKDQATAETSQCYRELVIHLNPKLITDQTDLEELVVHELCHAYTARLWDYAERLVLRYKPADQVPEIQHFLKDIYEESTTQITYAILATHRNPA